MANSTELGKWIISNAKLLNLGVSKSQWTSDWLPTHTHIGVTLEVNGQEVKGTGIDTSGDMAFIKASAEALERLVCHENGIHSSGVAAHTESKIAKENARFELLERDAFLSHFLTGEPFIETEIPEDNINYKVATDSFSGIGIELQTVKLKTNSNEHAFACFCTPRNHEHSFSSIIGLGYARRKKHAFEKAFTEALLGVIGYKYSDSPEAPLTLDAFMALPEHSPESHRRLYLSSEFQRNARELIRNTQTNETFEEKEATIEYKELFSSDPLLKSMPLRIFKASSNDIQHVFYGPTKPSSLNLERLGRFVGRPILESDINLTPHCLG